MGVTRPDDETIGRPRALRIGRYRLGKQLGRGACGVVFAAFDPELQRNVAIKIVHPSGPEGDEAEARLVREAQALASLRHPNVVTIFDVGVDEIVGERRFVYIVMELVEGPTLADWLEAGPRSRDEILDVFAEAAGGLAAAHASHVVHRDFKPSNAMIASGRVEVLDFGLARHDVELASTPRHAGSDEERSRDPADTRTGFVMGTPRYMSPEQHAGEEVGPAADQFAWCVALWHALAGAPPFQGRDLTELAAQKRDGPPACPARFEMRIHRVLAKGLHPDPSRRHADMTALLRELAAARRDRRRTIRMSVLAVGVVGAAAIAIWGEQRVQNSRALQACATEGDRIALVWNDDRAEAIGSAFAASGVSYAEDTWNRSRARLSAYAATWSDLRRATCERATVDHTLTPALAEAARACLDEHRDALQALLLQFEQADDIVIHRAAGAAASLPLAEACTDPSLLAQRAELPSDPDVRAQILALRSQLADVRSSIAAGRHAAALERAEHVLQEATVISWAPLAIEAQIAIAGAHDELGHYEQARLIGEQAFFAADAAGRDDLALIAATSLVLASGSRLARYEEAERWGRLSQTLVDRMGLSEDLAVANLLNNLGLFEEDRGRYEEARTLHERALAIREQTVGTEHLYVAHSLNHLAIALAALGSYTEAREHYERALAIREDALGPGHPDVATTLNNLANIHARLGSYAEARPLHERALSIREAALGPEHPSVAQSLINLAGAIDPPSSELEEALYRRALAIWEKALGPDDPNVAHALTNLAVVYQLRGSDEEAEALYQRALGVYENALGPDHPSVATLLNNLAEIHNDRGEYEEAKALQERALVIREKALGPEHEDVAMNLESLANLHGSLGSYRNAKPFYERALAIKEKVFGKEHVKVSQSLLGLAAAALEERNFEEAVAFAERAVAIRERGGAPAMEIAEARWVLANALDEAGRDGERARGLAAQARDAYRLAGDEGLAEIEAWLAKHEGG